MYRDGNLCLWGIFTDQSILKLSVTRHVLGPYTLIMSALSREYQMQEGFEYFVGSFVLFTQTKTSNQSLSTKTFHCDPARPQMACFHLSFGHFESCQTNLDQTKLNRINSLD